MAAEHLQRHNGSILHAVTHDLAVEDLHGTVITGVREQRQGRMELGATDGLVVVAEDLVRSAAEVHVVPQQSPVVRGDDEVVALRVQGDGGDPAGAGLEFALEFLLLQVVDADALTGGDEEEGFGRVEGGCLGKTTEAAEGVLREVFAEGVDCDGGGGGAGVGADGGEVVAATVPDEGLGHRAEGDCEVDALRSVGRDGTVPIGGRSLVGARCGLELWVCVGVVKAGGDQFNGL